MAMTKDRNTRVIGVGCEISEPVAGSTKLYSGGIIQAIAGYSGEAGGDSQPILGISQEQVDNSSGNAGDKDIKVKRGCEFGPLKNSGTDPVAQANAGADVYAEDAETICATQGSKLAVGKLTKVTSEGVFVYIP